MTPKQHARMLRKAEMSGRLDDHGRSYDAARAYGLDRNRYWPEQMPAEYEQAYRRGFESSLKINAFELSAADVASLPAGWVVDGNLLILEVDGQRAYVTRRDERTWRWHSLPGQSTVHGFHGNRDAVLYWASGKRSGDQPC